PERERRRPLVDLDPVDRECVTRIPTGIADAVAEKVAARDEAADDRPVALLGAFAGAESDPGNVAEHVFYGTGALLLDDRLRDVEDRDGETGDAGVGDLVGCRTEWRVCRGRGLRRRVRLRGRRRRGDRPSGRRLSDGGATRPARLHRHRRQRHVGFLLGRGRGCAGRRLLLIRRDLLWRRRWRLFGGRVIACSRFRLGLYRAAEAEQRRSYEPGGGAHRVSDVPSRWPHRNAPLYFRSLEYYS